MNNKKTDILIDEFLSSKKLEASDKFSDNLQDKLDSEKLANSIIDNFLLSQNLQVSENFVQKVLSSIKSLRRIELFKKITVFTGICAASLAVSYTAFFGLNKRVSEQTLALELASLDSEMTNFNKYASELEAFNADFYDYDLSLYKM